MDELLNFFLNHLGSVMAGSGGLIAVVMSVIQVSKIEINPWSQVATHIGNALNAGVMNEIKETKSELKDIRSEQEETRKKLDNHIEKGEETKAVIVVRYCALIMSLFAGLATPKKTLMTSLMLLESMKIIVRPIPTTKTTRCPSPSRTWGAYMTKCYALMVF